MKYTDYIFFKFIITLLNILLVINEVTNNCLISCKEIDHFHAFSEMWTNL